MDGRNRSIEAVQSTPALHGSHAAFGHDPEKQRWNMDWMLPHRRQGSCDPNDGQQVRTIRLFRFAHRAQHRRENGPSAILQRSSMALTSWNALTAQFGPDLLERLLQGQWQVCRSYSSCRRRGRFRVGPQLSVDHGCEPVAGSWMAQQDWILSSHTVPATVNPERLAMAFRTAARAAAV